MQVSLRKLGDEYATRADEIEHDQIVRGIDPDDAAGRWLAGIGRFEITATLSFSWRTICHSTERCRKIRLLTE